jgi:hypothetical protein
MILPPEAIKEFQELYEKQYGEKLTEAKAREVGRELIELYSLAMGKPLSNNL